MSRFTQILFSALLLTTLALGLALPVRAFDGRADDRITILESEVIDDDLYLAAEIIIIDGVIKGDLIAAGQTIIINGTVEAIYWQRRGMSSLTVPLAMMPAFSARLS